MSPIVRGEGPLRLLGLLVPGGDREEWLREWRGELAARPPLAVLLAAAEDAFAMRMRAARGVALAGELRVAVRTLGRTPLFTGVVVGTLALGIGANTAIFSVVRGVALRPLAYDDAQRIAVVNLAFGPEGDRRSIPASGPEFVELREENPAFAALAGYWLDEANLGGIEEPLRITDAVVTWDFLDVLGVRVALGRGFVEEDGRPGAEDVALLTHGLWMGAFGGDPDVLGSSVIVDDQPQVVVGVLPADFEFPAAEAQILRTLTLDPAEPGGRSSHWISMVARLADGMDVQGAQLRTDELVARWRETFPDRHGPGGNHPVVVRGIRDAMVGDLDGPLKLLGASVALVLLVACFNVANLLLVRGEDRQQELGVRTALGASRGAVLRQLFVESGILALVGGGLGIGLALAATAVLPVLAPGTLPPGARMVVDWSVLAFTAVVSGTAALLFGLAPAWLASRHAPGGALREGARGASSSRRRVLFRRGLVVFEVGMAVALLAAAGVLGRGLVTLMAVEPGFDPTGAVTLDFALSEGAYPEASDVAAFHDELGRRIGALPRITAVGSVRSLPLRPGGGWESVDLPGRTRPEDEGAFGWTVQYQVVGPGVFAALGVPVVEGRPLVRGDDVLAPAVVVLNETAARRLFPDGDAMGALIQLGRFDNNPNPVMTVVGIVGDVRQGGLDQEAPPQIYVPRAQAGGTYGGVGTRFATLVVRSGADPVATLASVRTVLRGLDPQLPVATAQSLEAEVTRSVGPRRFVVALMTAFSLIALALSAVGLLGLLSWSVSRRTREIGVRIALGAERTSVVGRVVNEAAALVVVGSVLGLGGAVLLSDLLEGLVFGVSPRDPVVLAAAPVVLLATGLLAAYLPARRASRVDPCEALRAS